MPVVVSPFPVVSSRVGEAKTRRSHRPPLLLSSRHSIRSESMGTMDTWVTLMEDGPMGLEAG